MDTPQAFALGAVGAGLVSLAMQIVASLIGRDDQRRLLIRVAVFAAVLALALSAAVLLL